MAFRPQTQRNQPKVDFWDTQINKIQNHQINYEYINENLFQWQEKKLAFSQQLIKIISNNSLDDSSDEDDTFEDIPRDNINQLKNQFSEDNSQTSIVLEIEGRRIMHQKEIRTIYSKKKSNHLKSDNQALKEYSQQVQQYVDSFILSIDTASFHFIKSMRLLIRYLLVQDDSVILQGKLSNLELLSIIYINLLNCINSNIYQTKKWLRSYTRQKKCEITNIPEWIKEILQRCINQFFINFKQFVESKSKRKLDDEKYQLDILKSALKLLREELKKSNSSQLSRSSSSNNMYQEFIGDFVYLPKVFEEFLKNEQDQRTLDLFAREFYIVNENIFNFKKISQIFFQGQQLFFKKNFQIQTYTTRTTLSRQYQNKNITNFSQLISEMELIFRSVQRNFLNGSNEVIHNLIFDRANDISVQFLFHLQKQPRKIEMKILNFSIENLNFYQEQLGLDSKEIIYLIRDALINGFDKNQNFKQLSKLQKQIIAYLITYFFAYQSYQSPSTMIVINMMLDLVQNEVIQFKYLFHQIPNEYQYEQFLMNKVNQIFQIRSHFINIDQSIKIDNRLNEFFQKRFYIVQTWLAMQKRFHNFSCVCQQDLIKKLIRQSYKTWFGIQSS